ncbi:probable disease resistance RPP8-like protein 2 [Cynara cardunculus var. scolymus]|uniref:probable disease resistance RPP8-like protein 2 n=1 Tax=Cynara cardunculus var. scolymus TaxID=59895 RepID=UPI000D62CF23|nr:probable disease resistance RPP8-like protein 2 [Cynara cardunculus var. scolymus]
MQNTKSKVTREREREREREMAVQAVVSVVIQKLSDLVKERSEIFESVRDEVKKVMEELGEMQRILNNAEHQEQSNRVLTNSVVQFLGKVYSLGDAIESFALTETRLKKMGFVKKHIFVMANEFKLCREVPDALDCSENVRGLKSKMKGFSKEIQEWKGKIPSLAPAPLQDSHTMRLHEQTWQESDAYYARKREDTIFKKDVQKLLKQITSDSKPLQIISVFGEIGIGKSAHVKTIYNKQEVKNKFDKCRALLAVYKNWSVRDLILAILRQMTSMKGLEKLKDEVLRGRLHGFLKGQKYLIVINDITSLDLLEKLRGALPDVYNGSRVVITTPDEEAASFADAPSRYHFKPVDMDDGLKIFIKKVWGIKGYPFSDEIEDLKNKIAESCKGTPLRISLLAGLLSTRKAIYEDCLRVFEQLDFATKSPSFDILAFCYNDLPLHLKPCFLYLGLFRKGFEIPVRRLFRLWLAEGFVKPSEEGIILEDIVEGYLEELVNRNMVEITKKRSDESPKKCRMIVVLHDIFLPRAVEIGLFHLHQKSDAAEEPRIRVRRLVEYTNIKGYLASKAFSQNLQSYISFNGRKKDMPAKEVGIFLERTIGARGFGLLKVLDLEGVYQPKLPDNLGNLFHLRYLGLRWTFLDTLPASLGGLLYLETLDIKHTHITTLPSSIWNMKHLRHLCLNGSRLDISAKSRGPSQIQILWGLFVDEKNARNIGLTLSRMTNLRKLDLTRRSSSTVATTITTTGTSHSSSYEEIASRIQSLSSLQSLRLRSKDKMGRPSELIVKPFSNLKNLSQLYLLGHLRKPLPWYQIPPGLKVLTLSVSQLENDPMPTLSQLSSLMVLRLLASSYVGEEMHCPENGFPALRVLKLWKLEHLKIFTVHEGTMQKLHTLEIRCCEKLEELPVTLLQIEGFDNLILTDMPSPFVSTIRNKKEKHTKIMEIKE